MEVVGVGELVGGWTGLVWGMEALGEVSSFAGRFVGRGGGRLEMRREGGADSIRGRVVHSG